MRAVWSFWSRPYLARTGQRWSSPLHHLLAWGLSLDTARRHYSETVLVTDRAGKQLLVDRLGLGFASVSTELDCLAGADPAWWALGKLVAYSIQDQPFVHIDNDVFLWKALPKEIAEAPVLAQCPEYFARNSGRGTQDIEHAFATANAALPPEWEWACSREDSYIREENCGIVGGCRVDFLRHYGKTAVDLLLHPKNAPAWSRVHNKSNMAIEQFFLAACVDFHRHNPNSPYRGVRVRYLFPAWDDATNPNCAARAGFTHLLADSKAHPAVSRRLEQRMETQNPGFLRHCRTLAGTMQ